jgi:hypothetical protein
LQSNESLLDIHLFLVMNTPVVEDAPLVTSPNADHENPFLKETLAVSESALQQNLEHLERMRADREAS